jgi:uncharacterized protein (DUF1778 family)
MPAKTPEQHRAYDAARRRSERLKLRLTEDEAQRIRNAAAGARMSLHAYILAVVDGRARPVVDLADVAQLSTPIAALLAAPQAMRDLEADLGRLSERLAHLFTADYALPSEHRAEIGATLSEVRDVLRAGHRRQSRRCRRRRRNPRVEIVSVLRAVNAALKT